MIGGTPLGHTVDLMMGGGLCYFQPNTSDYPRSCRGDQKDLLAQAKDDGYSVLTNRKQFDALDGGNNVTLPLIGLFTGSHMNYEIERNATLEPSLSEMTKTALQALKLATADSEKGFFIMVEGSKIDHAAHSHDLPGHLHEILEWNRAVQVIVDFIDEQENDDTVFIGAADHECGGLVLGGATVGGHEYQWVPEAISKSKNSAATLASRVVAYKGDDLPKFVEEEIYSAYGVFDANSTEIEGVVENLKTPGYVLEGVIADSLSRRAMCKWTTGGHSAVDVNLIAYPPHLTKDMVGNHGSTELARFVVDQLALDLNAITERLNAEDAETQDWRDTSVGTLKFVDGKPVGGALERRHHCD
ncbi:alkaline-phosphatase-like protein [Mrakia frigida]|uniref:alkaline-phosphatase-like protein n=1 Tax=Mrakia frigida TaxID=29902 RepID=UPI003FCBFA4A